MGKVFNVRERVNLRVMNKLLYYFDMSAISVFGNYCHSCTTQLDGYDRFYRCFLMLARWYHRPPLQHPPTRRLGRTEDKFQPPVTSTSGRSWQPKGEKSTKLEAYNDEYNTHLRFNAFQMKTSSRSSIKRRSGDPVVAIDGV